MSKWWLAGAVALSLAGGAFAAAEGEPEWALNATVIEACTCPMFCQCYFNASPSGHHEHGQGESHYCRFNNAYKVNTGHYGATQLDGAKFWMVGDLGGDFSQGKMDWTIVYFDKTLSPEQREAIGKIAAHLFPVSWNSMTVSEASIDRWEFDENGAVATMDGGRTAEVRLTRPSTANGPGPAVLKNIRYWGAPRNDGFVMMPNEVQAYRLGPKAYESKGTNGFMLTLDIDSNDVVKTAAK